MKSKRAVMELLGYEIINEVEDRILAQNIDGSFNLYIDGKMKKAYKAFKDEPLYIIWISHKYFKIGADLTIQEEINMAGGWVEVAGFKRYIPEEH